MTYRQTLRDVAHDNHGVVTLSGARTAGVPAVEVHKLTSRGALERVGKGVYRMLEVPVDALTGFAEAVASAGADAALADESVLAAHGLAQVNARTIRVATPHRVRAGLPPTVELVRAAVRPPDLDYIDGVPAMTVEAALIASRGRVMIERLVDAAHEAVRRDLITARQAQRVIDELSGE
ncbi:MAG: type IV toxin-antitoxin system AbiEi family antitoxin domain-containing protein [Dermatophilaceae bacterium]